VPVLQSDPSGINCYRILLHISPTDPRDRKIRLDLRIDLGYPTPARHVLSKKIVGGNTMKTWTKPAVREQEIGLEVTSYLPAEIDVI